MCSFHFAFGQTSHYDENKMEHGQFALFATPPTMEGVSGFFARNIIFLLDRRSVCDGLAFVRLSFLRTCSWVPFGSF